ncbi:ceramide transfer protein [Phymastichus coffea]|uniref:ceramide transfer protein n=1 Tax=Phymastichus coffea TaxID=108790 RepID=UPI00273C2501|nr:ceramide transfer protein [Phymastichus coffea]XP_058809621.1 ceramide transfer protein [Phymastichus coffea]XP_058809622.1 ceramide transfer protein [Phymastichus coffea]XP_058809623.1 ceramide transfer protein [Phymastichus coffea]
MIDEVEAVQVNTEIIDHGDIGADDDEGSDGVIVPELQGTLSKWTNYIHGWQTRFIVLKDGTLSYYKSEQDSGFGCRGSISLFKADVKAHELDECRFDVSVNDCLVWYLRANNPEEKLRWVDVLKSYKAESGYGSENSLKRHGSAISLVSNSQSTASVGSFSKRGFRSLKEKLAEIETFKDILIQQVDTLQKYFNDCAENSKNLQVKDPTSSEDKSNGLSYDPAEQAIDFKGEAITFKATSEGVIATLQHCVDLMVQREEAWRKRWEKEMEKQRKLQEICRSLKDQIITNGGGSGRPRVVIHGGPDYEEGPHSALCDDEFYDAMETGLDKIDEDNQIKDRLKQKSEAILTTPTTPAVKHRLWPEINKTTLEQLHYARLGVGAGGWQLFAEDGDMRMYRREEEKDGLVVDPLKACHVVRGVTGHEVCKIFFSPEYRAGWEATLEDMTVIENISKDTLVFLQTHKRIWPASQRDALFWSHIRKVPDDQDPDAQDVWIVCNHSTEYPDYPPNTGKCVRVYLTVCLVCQTLIDPPKKNEHIKREDITCKITYCSVVNPGGWAPASVLRAVYKREYPKFLKRFTNFCIDQCKDKPILF